MKLPIDRMLSQIEWQKVDHIPPDTYSLPYVTHCGVLVIGDINLKVYQLNNGKRIIDEEDLNRFLGIEATDEKT